jgi:chromosome segregation ATPase
MVLLLSLFKKAFTKAGEIHCLNTFRLFTKYSISQNKLRKLKNDFSDRIDQAANDDLISKINQLKSERENLIKSNENMIKHLKNECLKLEQNLKEKAMIIFNKNDEIDANREQIEILTQKNDGYKEQIELLNKKIDKLESKLNNTKLNIIEGI